MITEEQRIIIANDTRIFQAENHLPDLENEEVFERKLAFINKHKCEINAFIERRIEKVRGEISKRIGEGKHLGLPLMRETLDCVALAIGRKCAREFVNEVLAAIAVKPPTPRLGRNWLPFYEWRRIAAQIKCCAYGAMHEADKQQAKGA